MVLGPCLVLGSWSGPSDDERTQNEELRPSPVGDTALKAALTGPSRFHLYNFEPVRTSFARGALTGALLTVPLVAIWYAGWKTLDLPFPPFDLFDWIARILPGPIVTLVIDGLVRAFSALNIGPAHGAKLVEQCLAVGLAAGMGITACAIVFALLGASGEPATLFGAILGAMTGGLVVVMEDTLNRLTTPGAFASGIWLFATSLLWGLSLGWAYEQVVGATGTIADRRRFLIRVGNAAAATTIAAAVLGSLAEQTDDDIPDERWSSTNPVPNADAPVKPVPGTRREFTPVEDHYRVDVDTRAPALNRQRWRLRVSGLVTQPINFSLDELRRMEPLHQFVTLSCISNPPGGDLISTTRWTGVSLQRLLARLRVPRSATHLKITAADGFFEVVTVDEVMADPRIMLTYAWDGVPLPIEHGRPLRLFLPDRYGMKQPKWIVGIELIDHWEAGYWVSRGWDPVGRVKATSAVDVVEVSRSAGPRVVSVGGVAYAGARGISRVEVSIDLVEWKDAQLRPPMSATAWVVWRAEFPAPATAGEHAVAVRCYESDGTPQMGLLHSKRFTL